MLYFAIMRCFEKLPVGLACQIFLASPGALGTFMFKLMQFYLYSFLIFYKSFLFNIVCGVVNFLSYPISYPKLALCAVQQIKVSPNKKLTCFELL